MNLRLLVAKAVGSRTGLALLTIGLALMLFYEEIIFSSGVPALRDLPSFFYPLKYYLHVHLREFSLPLWNPHVAMGRPFVASFQSGVFYLPNLIFALPSPTLAFRIFFLFHYGVIAIGAFFYLRWRHHSHTTSIIGSLLLSLGGCMVSFGNVLNNLQAAAWLPWVLLYWEKLLLFPGRRYFGVFASMELLHFLGGSPEIFLMTNITLVGLNLFQYLSTKKRVYLSSLLSLFCCLGLIFVLTLPQILPTLEMFWSSIRYEGFSLSEVEEVPFSPLTVMNLLLPRTFLSPQGQFGFESLLDREIPWLLSIYIGLLPFLAGLFFLWQGRDRERFFWGVLFVLSFSLAMGSYNPLFPWLYHYLPFVAAFRYPEKFFYLTHLSLFVLSIEGLSLLLVPEGRSHRKKFLLLLVSLLFCLLLFYLLLSLRAGLIIRTFIWIAAQGIPLVLNPWALGHLAWSTERAILLSLAGVLLFIIWDRSSGWAQDRSRIWTRVLPLLFLSLIYTDLFSAHRGLNLYINAAFFSAPSPIALACGAPSHDFRLAHMRKNASHYDKDVSIAEQEKGLLRVCFPNSGILCGVDHIYGVDHHSGGDGMKLRDEVAFRKLLRPLPLDLQVKVLGTLNTRFIVSDYLLPSTLLHQIADGIPPHYFLYEVPGASERAYLAYRTLSASTPEDTLNVLLSQEFDSTYDVILDHSVPLKGSPSPDDHVRIISYYDEEVRIAVSNVKPAILVLNDYHYPGWEVIVDGEKRPILRANWWVRGVELAPGHHTVIFRYTPTALFLGLKISSATLAAVLLLCAVWKYRQRRAQE